MAANVVAWGNNGKVQGAVPSGLTNAVAIAAGLAHSLAVTADGRVRAQGWNDFGQNSIQKADSIYPTQSFFAPP